MVRIRARRPEAATHGITRAIAELSRECSFASPVTIIASDEMRWALLDFFRALFEIIISPRERTTALSSGRNYSGNKYKKKRARATFRTIYSVRIRLEGQV